MKNFNDILIGEEMMKKHTSHPEPANKFAVPEKDSAELILQNRTKNREFILRFLVTILLLLSFVSAPQAQGGGYVADPSSLGVGARPLGMGRAYVGVAEDGDAVFTNPAGLARSVNPKLSTMYTSLMGDVNYMVIGGVYPYGKKSALGAGIINSSSSDILLSNSDGSSAGTGRWGNTVMFLSAGTYLNELPAFAKLDRDVLIGGSFKYFSVGGTGVNDVADTIDSAGTAYGADIGILYPATEYLTLGANYQNILASKLTRSSGVNEDIPSTLKVGAKVILIGKEGQSVSPHSTRRLYLNADYDVNSNNQPNAVHAGMEFWPVNNLALRAGVDGTDPTMGIGIRLSGVEFNYAYHPYSGINENTTSFFSISYLGEAQKRMLRVKIDEPADKAVIYEDHVTIKGKVEVQEGDEDVPAGPLTLRIEGVNIPLGTDGTFAADLPVQNYGKKLVKIEAADNAGNTANLEARVVRLTSFADVPDGYWAKQPIENTGTVGLVNGYPDGSFRPESALTRAELATLLVRAKGLKLPDRQAQVIFKDVKPDFWAAKYVEVAYREGLIQGYPDKTFRPNNKINKVEGIAVLVRFDNMQVASEVFEKPYWDVSATHWGAKYVQAAKQSGMLKYVERNHLRPKEALARSESVEMLAKTNLAGGKIKDLYTWEKGFPVKETAPARPTIKASLY